MSRTIITKSKSEFFTNVSEEQLIGELCKSVNAKYFADFLGHVTMAYSMDENEISDTISKLKTLLNKTEEIYPDFKLFFAKECNSNDFKVYIEQLITTLTDSKGYECI